MKKLNKNIICWQNIERLVFKKQNEVYQAGISGNCNQVFYRQIKLLQSTRVKFIIIRRSVKNFVTHVIHTYYIILNDPHENQSIYFTNTFSWKQNKKATALDTYIMNSYIFQNFFIFMVIYGFKIRILAVILEPEWERSFSKNVNISSLFRVRYYPHDAIEYLRKKLMIPIYVTHKYIFKFNNFSYACFLKKNKNHTV